jgi:putative transposase
VAQHSVASRPMSARLACVVFSISETCYRYQGRFNDENSHITNWLIDLAEEQ